MKERRLISIPAQTISQLGEDTDTSVPIISVRVKSVVEGRVEVIRTGKESNLSKFRLEA